MAEAVEPAADAALRHLEEAEARARKPVWLPALPAPRPVSRCAVIGCGTMGAGIAWALLLAGLETVVVESDEHAVDRGRDRLRRLADGAVERRKLDPAGATAVLSRLTIRTGYDALHDVDIVVEAAFESMDVKKAIFASLDKAAPRALLATNTSYLDVNEIAAATTRSHDVIGLHFFSPAHIMKLLEVVRSDASSDAAIVTAYSLAERLGKIPVLAGVCDGFIGNRMLARYREIADMILLDGGLPWEVDEAMVEFGYAMGPYEAQDLSGLDIAYAERRRRAATRDPARRYVTIADRMVEEGRLGKKVGVGWYRYPGGGGAVIDPLLEDLIVEESHFARVKRRVFAPEEIRRRLLAAMIDEAAAILQEGIAASAADIDLVSVHGYGFPRQRGGLMRYAAGYGISAVVADIEEFSMENPAVWTVSPALKALAQQEAVENRATA